MLVVEQCRAYLNEAFNEQESNTIGNLKQIIEAGSELSEGEFLEFAQQHHREMLYLSFLFLIAKGPQTGLSQPALQKLIKVALPWLQQKPCKGPSKELVKEWIEACYELYGLETTVLLIKNSYWKDYVAANLVHPLLLAQHYTEAYAIMKLISVQERKYIVKARVELILLAEGWVKSHTGISDSWTWALQPAMERSYIQDGDEESEGFQQACMLILNDEKQAENPKTVALLEKIFSKVKRFAWYKGQAYRWSSLASGLVQWCLENREHSLVALCMDWAKQFYEWHGVHNLLYYVAHYLLLKEPEEKFLNALGRVNHFEEFEQLEQYISDTVLLGKVYDVLAKQLMEGEEIMDRYSTVLMLAEKITTDHPIHAWMQEKVAKGTYKEGLVAYAMKYSGGNHLDALMKSAEESPSYWSSIYAKSEYIQALASTQIDEAISRVSERPKLTIINQLIKSFTREEHWLKLFEVLKSVDNHDKEDIVEGLKSLWTSPAVIEAFVDLATGLTEEEAKIAAIALLSHYEDTKATAQWMERLQTGRPKLSGRLYGSGSVWTIAKAEGGDINTLNKYIIENPSIKKLSEIEFAHYIQSGKISTEACKRLLEAVSDEPESLQYSREGRTSCTPTASIIHTLQLLESDPAYESHLKALFTAIRQCPYYWQVTYHCAVKHFLATASLDQQEKYMPWIFEEARGMEYYSLLGSFAPWLVKNSSFDELIDRVKKIESEKPRNFDISYDALVIAFAVALSDQKRYGDSYQLIVQLDSHKRRQLEKLADVAGTSNHGAEFAQTAIHLLFSSRRPRPTTYRYGGLQKNQLWLAWTALVQLAVQAGDDAFATTLIQNVPASGVNKSKRFATALTELIASTADQALIELCLNAVFPHLGADYFEKHAKCIFQTIMVAETSKLKKLLEMIFGAQKLTRGVALVVKYTAVIALWERGEETLYQEYASQLNGKPNSLNDPALISLLLNDIPAGNVEQHFSQVVNLYGTEHIASALKKCGQSDRLWDCLSCLQCSDVEIQSIVRLFLFEFTQSSFILQAVPYVLSNYKALFLALWNLSLALLKEGKLEEAEAIVSEIEVIDKSALS
ncbi:hypothetical protein AAG747_01705 [Rapidithrix thailandica]|uniref:Uncharacterized protein n=1 Tax=Rapidithrix thailandica TaxID=413964 RepID=A0AAW9RSN4_9BACT